MVWALDCMQVYLQFYVIYLIYSWSENTKPQGNKDSGYRYPRDGSLRVDLSCVQLFWVVSITQMRWRTAVLRTRDPLNSLGYYVLDRKIWLTRFLPFQGKPDSFFHPFTIHVPWYSLNSECVWHVSLHLNFLTRIHYIECLICTKYYIS